MVREWTYGSDLRSATCFGACCGPNDFFVPHVYYGMILCAIAGGYVGRMYESRDCSSSSRKLDWSFELMRPPLEV